MDALSQDESLVQRRRAIYTGLLPYLDGEDIYTALWLWQDHFSRQPALALHGYLREIGPLLGKTIRRSEVHRSLVAALGRKASELAPDPHADMLAYREGRFKPQQRVNGKQASVMPATRVFETILAEFFQYIDDSQPLIADKIRHYMSQHITGLDLSLPAFTELGQWLNGLRVHLHQAYAVEEMRKLLHIAYVGGCEYLGPVASDEVLAAAVARAERLPEALLFPPRQLL